MQVFEVRDDSILWRGGGETVQIQAWGESSLRVRSRICGPILDTDFALLEPRPVEIEVAIDGLTATVRNGNIVAILTASQDMDDQVGYEVPQCHLEFRDCDGRLLLSELSEGGSLKRRARDYQAIVGGDHRATASFEPAANEKLFGMGQYQQDDFNIKGCTFELAHRNSQASVPFVLSNVGYGFLWHNPAIGRVTFATNRTDWFAESTQQIDYWITAETDPRKISAAYAGATGFAPMMPEFGLGYWQCKLRYWNQEQLLEVAREHKRRGLPLDVIVADFFHWPKMGDFRFDEEFWPDPKAMIEELNEMGVELMVSVWPQISIESENFSLFNSSNALVKADRGIDVHMVFQDPSAFFDPTSPAARALLWDVCRKNYHDLGVKLFWLDEAEPEYGSYDFDHYRYYAGPNVQIGNIYPQMFARTFYDGQIDSGQSDVVNLLRCAWAGSQRYGALVWSGDIHSTFQALRNQLAAGLHMGIAGIPWFTTDIGGFHKGDVRDPEFHELLIRWFQFATFCPVMRMHGDREPGEEIRDSDGNLRCRTGGPNELWSFGDEVGGIVEGYVRLREQMRPYTRSLMLDAHENGQPILRTLFHEFPEDLEAWEIGDQYLFGPDVLVAPVMEAGQTKRSVYLPSGSAWIEVATGKRVDGGQRITVDAPLEQIPLFTRNEELLPLLARPAGATLQ